MVNVRQILSSVFAAAVAMSFAGSAIAEAGQTPKPMSDKELQEARQETEKLIQKCIRNKAASPKICRMTAYAAALATGFPPEEAERVTGYRPEDSQER